MMNTVKRFAALVLALGFLAGLCGAAAETAGTEEYTGVWYLTTVRIDGEEYDVSHSAERRIVEFGEGNTGRIINSYDKEEKQFSWTAEENGLRTCAVTDSENRTELVPMVIAENRLVLMYVDGGYIFTREEGERADIRYGMAAEFSVAPGSEEMADGIAAVMRQRLEEQGCADATAERSGTGGIRVEIPDTQDVELIDLISATGELRFLDPDDEVILTRDQVESAEYYNQYGTPGVCIRMTEEGTKLFAEATAANIGTISGLCWTIKCWWTRPCATRLRTGPPLFPAIPLRTRRRLRPKSGADPCRRQ